jgi:8-oxo-dGTP diphosphatase
MPPGAPASTRGPDGIADLVVAAGAVVTRRRGREVLVVHRPKYDDWSFPKGKQDPGEHVTATAVREVLEETGVPIRLGRPLQQQAYLVSGGRTKVVHYWVGRVLGDPAAGYVGGWVPNDEVDEVGWLTIDEAARTLSYVEDVELLGELADEPRRTHPLVVVRHAEALPRKEWEQADSGRPLTDHGFDQAAALAPLLASYGVARLVTSPSVRCVQTLQPYADLRRLKLHEVDGLSEEQFTGRRVRRVIDNLLDWRQGVAACSHRPVLPLLLDALGVDTPPLAPAELVVCHHRKGRIVALERHAPSTS